MKRNEADYLNLFPPDVAPSLRTRRVRKQAARRSRAEHVLPLPEHETGAVRQHRRAAGAELRGRPATSWSRSEAAPISRSRAVRCWPPTSPATRATAPTPRPGQGQATGRRVRHDRAGGHGVDAGAFARRPATTSSPCCRASATRQGSRWSVRTSTTSAPWRPRKVRPRPASAAWTPDYPSSAAYFSDLLTCAAYKPGQPDNINSADSATRASTARSPGRPNCRRATRTRRACSGARSTARSSTRHRG